MDDFQDEEVEHLTVIDAEDDTYAKKALLQKLKLPLMITGVVIVVGVVLWWIFLRGDTEKLPEDEIVEVDTRELHKPEEFGNIYVIKDLIVNPAGGARVFMVSVALEFFDKGILEELSRKEPLLRDNMITLFSAQSKDVLTNIRYRRELRKRVKKIMDYQLGEGVITRVFFEKWIYQ